MGEEFTNDIFKKAQRKRREFVHSFVMQLFAVQFIMNSNSSTAKRREIYIHAVNVESILTEECSFLPFPLPPSRRLLLD